MYLQIYRVQKAWLLKCLKSQLAERLWTLNMLKCPKHSSTLHSSSFVIFFIILKELQFERFCLGSISDLEIVC